jgi:hypothetical protein
MSISLLETYIQICKLFSKINEFEEILEKNSDKKEEIEKKIKQCEDQINELQKLIDEGKCINDIPEYEDNREGCKHCSGCKYCQRLTEFDLADEI